MLFAHYSIPLPADYDLARIRDRVAAKADHWDRRPGLVFKAFCVAERDAAGTVHNAYSPLYVWANPDAFTDFLTGAEYAALSGSFGVVAVHTGAVLQLSVGSGPAPAVAVRETRALTVPADLARLRHEEGVRHREAFADGSVHSRWVTLDSRTWTVSRYTLLHEAPPPLVSRPDVQLLQVLHFARPGVGAAQPADAAEPATDGVAAAVTGPAVPAAS
jgi:hypothetical protein